MVVSAKSSVSSLYRYFKVPKEFSSKLSAAKLPHLSSDGCPGWTTLAVGREYDRKLVGKSLEDEASVRQWVEYAVTFALHVDDLASCAQVLKEVNKVLGIRSYIATNYLTVADLLLFFILHSVVASMSYYEKELYINVSRWFDHLQRESSIRQTRSFVPFSRTLLYS